MAVHADRLLTDEQDVPDLAVGALLGQEVEDFGLALGQTEPAEGLSWAGTGCQPASPVQNLQVRREWCCAQRASRGQR